MYPFTFTHLSSKFATDYIKQIDKIVAHFVFIYILFIDTPKIMKIQPLIILFPLLLLSIWILEHIYPQYFILLHSIFH